MFKVSASLEHACLQSLTKVLDSPWSVCVFVLVFYFKYATAEIKHCIISVLFYIIFYNFNYVVTIKRSE